MRLPALIFAALLLPIAALAQPERTSDAILDALKLDRMLVVLQQEAVNSGGDLFQMMGGDPDSDGWATTLARIAAPETLAPMMRDDFHDALEDRDTSAILDFWQSREGQRIATLELSAREALADPEVEDMMLDRFEDMDDRDAARGSLLREFVRVNDLIESNVVGAMNSNVAFLRGLRDGAPESDLAPPDDAAIMAEIWAQQDEIRESTQDWVHAFVALAYEPLNDAELKRYIAFCESDVGQAFNRALFQAFDRMFLLTSRQTGESLSRILTSEEL